MKRYSKLLTCCSISFYALIHAGATPFNPVPGNPVWSLVAQTGIISSAIEGTQNRIQQSDIGTGGYTISTPGRYALIQNISYVPAGATPAINITASNVYLDLNGFTISYDGANVAPIIQVIGGPDNVIIDNGTLINTSGADVGIRVTVGAEGLVLNNIAITGCTSSGVNLISGNTNAILYNLRITDSGVGIAIDANSQITCQACVVSGGTTGLGVDDGSELVIRDCQFFNNSSRNLDLNRVTDVSVENIVATNAGSDAIRLNNTGVVPPERLVFHNITIANPVVHGMHFVEDAQDITITNCTITSPGGHGILFDEEPVNITLESISITNSGATSIEYGEFAQNLLLTNVSVQESGDIGIDFSPSSTAIVMKNVSVEGAVSTGINFQEFTHDVNMLECYVSQAGDQGFMFVDCGVVSMVNCQAIDNDASGFFIIAFVEANPTLSVTNCFYHLNGCVAINNHNALFSGGSGFIIGVNAFAVNTFLFGCHIENCVALGNNTNGFSLGLDQSLVSTCRSEFHQFNFTLRGVGNQMIDNVGKSPAGGGTNFTDLGFSNMYLGNSAQIFTTGSNYASSGTSFIQTVSLDPKVTWPTLPESRWQNLDIAG